MSATTNNDFVFRGAAEICKFIKRDYRRMQELIEVEKLPAWRCGNDGVYYALQKDLISWLELQRNKYLPKKLSSSIS